MTYNLANAAHLILEFLGSFLRYDNKSLHALILTCRRFHRKRLIWISNISMKYITKPIYFPQTTYNLIGNLKWWRLTPLYWNKVFKIELDFSIQGSEEIANTFVFDNLRDVSEIILHGWKQSSIGPFNGKTTYLKLFGAGNLSTIFQVNSLIHLEIVASKITEIISEKLERIHLCHCYDISNFDMTPNLMFLFLENCHKIKELSNLLLLKSLVIHGNCSLVNISNLPNLKSLEIFDCQLFKTLDNLPKLCIVKIRKCPKFVDLRQISHVRDEIHLRRMNKIDNNSDLQSLCQARFLSLRTCDGLTNFEIFAHIPKLEIDKCWGAFELTSEMHNNVIDLRRMRLTNLNGLKFVSEVNLIECPNVSDVSPLANCQSVRIIYCHRVKNVKSLFNIKNLTHV